MAGELILIVEDEELIALEMKKTVSSWGFNAVTVRGGEEALRLCGETPPPLALMDIKLQGTLDGIETATLLRERHGTAVIFITAYSDLEIIDRAKHSMPFGFLVKPVQDRELRASIETALYMHDVEAARRRAEEELQAAHDGLERRVEERTRELRQSNEALRQSEERYRMLFENARIGIGIVSMDGSIRAANPAMASILGYTLEDMHSMNIQGFYVNPAERELLLARLSELGHVAEFETSLRHRNGSIVHVNLYVNKILWNGREALHEVMEDITERKQALDALIQAHAELDKRVAERTAELAGTNRLLEAEIDERKKAELVMYEMKERLEMTQEAAGAGSWDWDVVSGRIVWSQKMFELFGLDSNATEASFDAWRSVLHPDDKIEAEERITRALETRADLDNVYRIIQPGGEARWIYALGKGVYDDQGRPLRMGGICIDITRSKQMQEMLRISEEKFSKAFMASPEAISIATMDEGVYVEVNDVFLARTGFNRDEVIGRTSAEIKVWVDSEERIRYVNELTTGGRLRDFEVRYRMKDGEIRDFLVSSEIISLSGKQCSLNYIIDITDRKRIEAILRREHENFMKIFSAAPVGLLLLDAYTVVTHANSAMGTLVLRDPAEIIGSRGGGAIGCIHSREDPRGCGFSSSCPDCPLRRGIEGILAGGVPLANKEINLTLLINGVPREKWLSVSAESVVIDGKDRVIIAVVDISDIKKAEELAEIERELLRRCNRAETVTDLIKSLALYMKYIVGCEAVGIRLRDGDDFPYYETHGFPEDFVLAEKKLCARDREGFPVLDGDGNPVLECMCGNILCGRFDPAKPFFTPHGSFWTGSTTELLATTTEEDRQARTRNRCHGEGYESVALIPIRVRDRVLGLFQFNDRRRGLYSAKKIEWVEHLVDFIAISLARLITEKELRKSEERYRTVADFTFDWEFWIAPDGRLIYVSPSCERITGYTPSEFITDPGLMMAIVHPDDAVRVRGHFERPEDISCETGGFDYRIIRKDGEVRWIGHRCQIVCGAGGRPLGRRGSHRDITDRKRAEEEVLRLNRHIITLQEQERQRVAKDLHDGVSQLMNAAKLNFAAFSQDPEKNRERFDTGMEFIDLSSRELREVYSNLYPAALEDLGLAAAVRLYTKNFLANRGIEAEVTIDDDLRLPMEVQIDLYRVIQESCSNIARHSGATLARVTLWESGGMFTLEIFDNGSGFDPVAPRSSEGGFGIINMKQRVKHLNGAFELETGSSGTRITIIIPGGERSHG